MHTLTHKLRIGLQLSRVTRTFVQLKPMIAEAMLLQHENNESKKATAQGSLCNSLIQKAQ